MASLQARSPLRSTYLSGFISKLASLFASILLLGVGWVSLCYLRSEVIGRFNGEASGIRAAGHSESLNAFAPPAAQTKRLSTPIRLVYSCAADKTNYHSLSHLPGGCDRSALSEEAARQRDLLPCKVCFAGNP